MSFSGLIKDYLQSGTHAARPVSPNVATGVAPIYYETDTGNTFAWSGSVWVQLNAGGGGSSVSVAVYEEQQSSGTNGGASSSGDQIRAINTEVADPGNIATISGNQVTITNAGTYEIQFWATNFGGEQHQVYLYDITNSAVLHRGLSTYNESAAPTANISTGQYIVVLVAARTIELRHYITHARATDGLGTQVGQGTEVYSAIIIRKIA